MTTPIEAAEQRLRRAIADYNDAPARALAARNEEIRAAAVAGLKQVDIVRITGYTRETVRRALDPEAAARVKAARAAAESLIPSGGNAFGNMAPTSGGGVHYPPQRPEPAPEAPRRALPAPITPDHATRLVLNQTIPEAAYNHVRALAWDRPEGHPAPEEYSLLVYSIAVAAGLLK